MTDIIYADELGVIVGSDHNHYQMNNNNNEQVAALNFQVSGADDHGGNGFTLEGVLFCCKKRLEFFNEGEFQCVENDKAIDAINAAIASLISRKQRRMDEGKYGSQEA